MSSMAQKFAKYLLRNINGFAKKWTSAGYEEVHFSKQSRFNLSCGSWNKCSGVIFTDYENFMTSKINNFFADITYSKLTAD